VAIDRLAKDWGAGMDHDLNRTNIKKPYEPPQLTTISLRPEEAVLGHCKISGTAGPGQGSCAALFCMSQGS
jgi:hypothetical protein